MSDVPDFYLDTVLASALRTLLLDLEVKLELTQPIKVFLAGGMAVHLYTGSRVTCDVDAEFSARILIPSDLTVEVELEDGQLKEVYFDTNYNSTFALMHEDYDRDSIPIDLGLGFFQLNVLSPIDLAVSKIARFAPNDKEDIATLVAEGLVTADQIEARALEAAATFVGGERMMRMNIRDAVDIARIAEVAPEAIERYRQLPNLSGEAGAAHTFGEKAREMLTQERAASPHHLLPSPLVLNWRVVHQRTMEASIGDYGQAPDDVHHALAKHSPGAVSTEQIAEVRKTLDQNAAGLQAKYELRQDGPTQAP